MDGNGLSKIEDENVAKAINEKVNAMNTQTGVIAIPVAIFAALDVSQSRALVLSAVIGAVLYYMKGRIPDEVN